MNLAPDVDMYGTVEQEFDDEQVGSRCSAVHGYVKFWTP